MYKIIRLIVLSLLIASQSYAQTCNPPNKIDSLGLKQGEWIEFEARPSITGITIYELDNEVSEIKKNYNYDKLDIYKLQGCYKDGIRIGVWQIFLSSGVKKYTVNYKNSVIGGEFKSYYSNGAIKLQGIIERNTRTQIKMYSLEGKLKKEYYIPTSELIQKILK